MKNPSNPCPFPGCDLLLLSSYYDHYNELSCYNNHYESYWTKEDNQLVGETITFDTLKIQNNLVDLVIPTHLID